MLFHGENNSKALLGLTHRLAEGIRCSATLAAKRYLLTAFFVLSVAPGKICQELVDLMPQILLGFPDKRLQEGEISVLSQVKQLGIKERCQFQIQMQFRLN
jgi:hypothetical protein